MKQLFQDIRTGQTSVIEVPIPAPQPGMALVRTSASIVSTGTERTLVEFAGKSLMGKARARPDLVRQTLDKVRREGLLSSLEAVRNRLDQPMPLGYSSCGTIVALGEGVTGFRPGDRVACAGGGYAVHAEFALVPQNLLTHLPDAVDDEAGAFTTLGAIALHGFRLSEPQVGDRIAVIGLGVLGLLTVGIARSAGCPVFAIDIDPSRVERARQMGAHGAVRSEAETAAAAFTQGLGFDAVLICAHAATSDPLELAAVLARDRGRVVALGVVGLEVPRKAFFEKELTFLVSRSYGPGRYDPSYEEGGLDYPYAYVRWTEGRNLAAFVSLMAEGRLDPRPLITHRFPIERGADAYALISGKQAESFLGVLLTYPAQTQPAQRVAIRVPARQASPAATVRLGVLGAGAFATGVLLPALQHVRGIELVGLATGTGLKAATAGRRFGFRFAATDEAELLGSDEINSVAVLTRHGLHARQVVAALRAGKHVFCEKPLAIRREEVGPIVEALRTTDRILMVGYNRRFSPLARRLKAFLEPAGEPLVLHYRVNAGLLPRGHWHFDPVQGGGRIASEVCHFIDLLTYLTGHLPTRVHTRGLPESPRYQEENVVISLEFSDGSLGTIAYLANGDRAFPKEHLEVFGGGRTAVLDDFRRLHLAAGGRRTTRRSLLRQDKGHRAEWEAFATAVAAGGPPPIPYEQLIPVTLVTLAARESLRLGQPITIEPFESPA